MREKKLFTVFAFSTTTAALQAERLLGEAGLPGRLIPLPPQISAGCGLAWAMPPERGEEASVVLQEAGAEHSAHSVLLRA